MNDLLTNVINLEEVTNSNLFSEEYNYSELLNNKEAALQEWKHLSKEEQNSFGKIEKFYKSKGITEPSESKVVPSKNLHLVKSEIEKRITLPSSFSLILLDELHSDSALIELVENIENTEQIREIYKLRKQTTGKTLNAGINATEATRLKNCMRQGRELFQTGKSGSLMVKPLNYFYSLTAYAYAVIILNNPIRYSLDNLPGSHGVNYIPTGMKIQFGGDMPTGTFSDLFCSYPTFHIKNQDVEINQSNLDSIMAFFKQRTTVNVGILMSMIPEMREYYKLVTGTHSRTYPLQIVMSKDSRTIKWEFQIGDGETKPSSISIENAFKGFTINERHGKFFVEVPASDVHNIKASIITDIRGDFWFIENPFHPVILPEICLHFLLTNIFSNLMRYTPDRWGTVLLNEVNSSWSLISRKYLSCFENKYPQTILKSISKYYPYIVRS